MYIYVYISIYMYVSWNYYFHVFTVIQPTVNLQYDGIKKNVAMF